MTQKVSTEVQTESTRIASGIKKPGQSREQTKLIAAGIEKGIAEYKKQHKAKARQLDKQKKQKIRCLFGFKSMDIHEFPEIILIWHGFIHDLAKIFREIIYGEHTKKQKQIQNIK